MNPATRRFAPIFPARALKGTGGIGGSFSEWVEHYNGCDQCANDDWYSPIDQARFCDEGRFLFGVWERAAGSSHYHKFPFHTGRVT